MSIPAVPDSEPAHGHVTELKRLIDGPGARLIGIDSRPGRCYGRTDRRDRYRQARNAVIDRFDGSWRAAP